MWCQWQPHLFSSFEFVVFIILLILLYCNPCEVKKTVMISLATAGLLLTVGFAEIRWLRRAQWCGSLFSSPWTSHQCQEKDNRHSFIMVFGRTNVRAVVEAAQIQISSNLCFLPWIVEPPTFFYKFDTSLIRLWYNDFTFAYNSLYEIVWL